MLETINQFTLQGRLGADPEVKKIGDDLTLMRLSLATKTSRKNQDGSFESGSDWHQVKVFGELADQNTHLKKGDALCVSGKIKPRSFESAAGETRYVIDLVASTIEVINTQEGNDNEA